MLFIVTLTVLFHIRFSIGDQCPSAKYCTCSSDLTIMTCTNHQLTDESLVQLSGQLPRRTTLLNLSSNSLTSIDSLLNLNHLETLDLSFNKLESFPLNFLSKFPRLSSLYLQNNSLKTLHQLSNLNLDISNNPFNCTYHSKLWACHNFNSNRSMLLTYRKNFFNHFCQSVQMNTSKGHFYWPRTLLNKKIENKCPFGSAAWLRNSSEYPQAYHTCSSKGQWINLDLSHCAFRTNISRIFDRLSLNETNLLLKLVKYLSKVNVNSMNFDDIILLIDFIDEQQDKHQNHEKIMFIYHLTDFILQIKQDYTFSYEYRLAITRLRLILERLLSLTHQSWLYIGKELTAMTLKSPLSSTICFVPNRSLLTIICDIDNKRHESQLATIQFPSYSYINYNQSSLFRIIFYRQSTLFTPDVNQYNRNPVIYIQSVSINSLSSIKLTFYAQSNQASIGIWYPNETSWEMKSSICELDEQNINFISANCLLLNDNSLSITYIDNIYENKNPFFHTNYSQLAIYISSIIASTCLLICILFYIRFHRIYLIPRRFFHCLINYWFCFGILLLLFAFGIRKNQYPFLCQFIAICLHYLCLATILWLTFLTYSIWRKPYVICTNKDKEKSSGMSADNNDGQTMVKVKYEPVIQLYIFAYGIAFIICGVNVVISRKQYITNKICFLNNFESFLILSVSMIIFILLLLSFLLAARINIKRLTNQTIHLHNLSNKSDIHPKLNILNEENLLSLKFLPILISPNPNDKQILQQHQPMNQLLSILFQLILLIFLFLSSLTVYLHPLHSFNLRFEHIIYTHLYGFFLLLLTFYILSFYVLSRSDLLRHCYLNKKTNYHLTNQSYIESIPSSINSMVNKENDDDALFTEEQIPISSSSSSSSHADMLLPTNSNSIDDLNEQTNITSRYHRDILQTSLQHNIQNHFVPLSPSDTVSQETINDQQPQRNSFYEQSPNRMINSLIEPHEIQNDSTPFQSLSFTSSRSFIRSQTFPSHAIIRPLPIIRLSSLNKTKNLSEINSNNTNHLILQKPSDEKLSVWKKPPNGYPYVAYIDEDDEGSLSLKSSIYNSSTTSPGLTRKDRSQTLSLSNFSNEIINDTNHLRLHESNV